MPLSRVITTENAEQYRIKSLEFGQLEGPLPEPASKADSFTTADFFTDRAVSRSDAFAPSFGPREKKPPPEAEPPPLTPEELVAQAQEQAAALVAQAQEEAEGIRDQAREEGRQDGLEAGAAELEALKTDASTRLLNAAAAIENTQKAVLSELEKELVGLTIAAASKVVAREIQTNPRVAANVVLSALKLTSRTRWVKVRINPADLEMVETLRPGIEADYPDLAKVDLIPDDDVAQGGCLVVTESEEIDATLETRLANLAQEMDRVLKGIPHEG